MTPELTTDDNLTNSSFSAQLPRNLGANIAYFLANVVIGILLVPFFISSLGVAAYGLIPLVTSVTGYVAIVVQSLNISISRFLTIDLQRKDYVAANRTFNTSFFGISAVILLMVPIVITFAYYVPSIFRVPAGYETDAIILFLGVCAAFLIRSWSGNFTVQIFACNRLDLQNLVNLINLIIQTGLIVLLFTLFGPNLALVGGSYFVGAIVASGVSIVFARRVCPQLQVSMRFFDRTRVKDLCGMGWWVVINQVGSLLFLQIDLILVNILFGAASAGEYAIAIQWAVLLRAMAGVLSGVVTPAILSYYAKKNTETLILVMKSSVKLLGLAMALPIGLICGLSPQLLTVWVGEEYNVLWPLVVLLTIHLAINLSIKPLFSINVAYNMVRTPGVITIFMGMGNIVLAIALSVLTDWGFYGVAVAGAVILSLKNVVFTPWYATKVLGLDGHTFTQSMFPGVVATVMVGIGALTLGAILPFAPLVTIVIAGSVISITYFLAVWTFGISKLERGLFQSYIPSNLRRDTI